MTNINRRFIIDIILKTKKKSYYYYYNHFQTFAMNRLQIHDSFYVMGAKIVRENRRISCETPIICTAHISYLDVVLARHAQYIKYEKFIHSSYAWVSGIRIIFIYTISVGFISTYIYEYIYIVAKWDQLNKPKTFCQ